MLLKKSFLPLFLIGFITGCQTTSFIKPYDSPFDNVDSFVDTQIIAKEKGSKEYTRGFEYGLFDLNDDGREELMVMMKGSWFCGTGGCSTYLFNSDGTLISKTSVTNKPILVSNNITNGYHDLIVWSNNEFQLLNFDGNSYPYNPSAANAYQKLDPSENDLYQERINKAIEKVKNTELFLQDGNTLRYHTGEKIFDEAYIHKMTFEHYGDPMTIYIAKYNDLTDTLTISNKPK
ncbi:MAG: hypothetical protein CL760_12030 [Chloroflexi bacterium]|nr:hypothetical protein [Chloroflexota bacterium]|tara:strand:+ start:24479 stop:25177 length:699 start_codon:yes stop_codon:yes gene_type:complete